MTTPRSRSLGIGRRAALGGAAGVVLGSASERAGLAQTARPPVLFVSHGSPRLPIDPIRSGELHAWGASLPRPRAILAMTPHFGTRRLTLGAIGPGQADYNMPDFLRRQLPQGLTYATPSNLALAARVEALLAGVEAVDRSTRAAFDHTVWMPLMYLFPAADAPVLELSFPYRNDRAIFALGQRLAPLRDEGVLVLASGQITHNLAAVSFEPVVSVPAWSQEFDQWGAEVLQHGDIDAVLDWRKKAPAPELAHPDDGGHFRVLLFALGVASASGGIGRVTFPVKGFESTMSKRAVEVL